VTEWTTFHSDHPAESPRQLDNWRRDQTRYAEIDFFKHLAALLIAILLSVPGAQRGHARDNGRFAGADPELKAWFDSLRSGQGPCCSDADGTALSDVDWESKSGHYRVRLEGEWVDVPDDAVITVPNRVGRTMVWPMYRDGKMTPRCFMPGSMT
jgi:hypothetical protein